MLAHIVVFWAVRHCHPVGGYKGFGGVSCFHLKGRNKFIVILPARLCIKWLCNKQIDSNGNASDLYLRGA
jgi:hypothetical protein